MLQVSRSPLIIGNWKMFKTIVETKIFVSGLAVAINHANIQIGLAVPFTMIAAAAEVARGTSILIGGQNVFEENEGAFTGEISPYHLKDAGASFVLIGHSERRRLFKEDDMRVNKKIKSALAAGLRVVMCIGESLEDHEAGKTFSILENQLKTGLVGVPKEHLGNFVLAYEPVWAIGTGLTATPDVAEAAHRFCRNLISQLYDKATADHVLIQYGGSVGLDNAVALLDQPDIDGLLIGGASLNLDTFIKIIQSLRLCDS